MDIINNPQKLKELVELTRFMSFNEYLEYKIITKDQNCYKCGRVLEPLTYLDPDFYTLPCWNCLPKKKSEQNAIVEGIIRNIRDFYTKITGDRYFQLFVVDEVYTKATLASNYNTFKHVINTLVPPSRNDIWFLDWEVGYPKLITTENLPGIKIINLSDIYKDKIISDKTKITVGEYQIDLPEISTIDRIHSSRYSILVPGGERKSKRIKLGDKCYRFYNTDFDDTKSILKISKNGEPVSLKDISYQDFVVIKLVIMRNKTFLRLIFDIIEEITRNSRLISDSVFLKNTVLIDPRKDPEINLIWTMWSKYRKPGKINISII